jgi:hypothetical protein
MDDLTPWHPDISRDEMLNGLHNLLAEGTKDLIALREHVERLRIKIREIQADPNWTA